MGHGRQSTQRDSNPHIRHGKAVGCRLHHGCLLRRRVVKEPASRPPVGPERVELSPPRLKVACAADYATVPFRVSVAFVAVQACHRVGPLLRVEPVGREALESSSAVFQTAANPSQLPTQKEKARHPES